MATTTLASTATAAATAAAATTTSPFGDLSKLPHDSKKPAIIAAGIITLFLSGCFVAARFYTRMFITRTRIGASEYLVLLAWIFSFGVTIPQVMETGYGMGAHLYDIPPGGLNLSGNAEAQLISIFFYSLSLTFSKFSILALYLVVFPYSWVRSVSVFLIFVVAASQIWMLYVIFTACTPLQAFWDSTIVGATCHPQAYWLANQYQLIATDFLIFLLPLPVVWRLKVRPGQKILLVFVFAMGFFVCAISIIRIELIIPLTNNPGPDFTYSGVATYYWTDVETNLAIVVASSITLKPFISRLLPRSLIGSSAGEDFAEAAAAARVSPNRNRSRLHSLFDPIITLRSRISRRPGGGSMADDTKALRSAQNSHASSRLDAQSTGNRTIMDRSTVDEEMGIPPQTPSSPSQMMNEQKLPTEHIVHSTTSYES
ncbi:hypothetical protein SEUCBS139899_002104 [Sporothrix eucalyptigena]|uniref:Rhodopsin domain-containing protein n=1 Tax=Sporothrix eucalyptigena TaxID=1812306 RepID=A0ABP0D1Q2_9PEZI